MHASHYAAALTKAGLRFGKCRSGSQVASLLVRSRPTRKTKSHHPSSASCTFAHCLAMCNCQGRAEADARARAKTECSMLLLLCVTESRWVGF